MVPDTRAVLTSYLVKNNLTLSLWKWDILHCYEPLEKIIDEDKPLNNITMMI